jgi:hypothetical protein
VFSLLVVYRRLRLQQICLQSWHLELWPDSQLIGVQQRRTDPYSRTFAVLPAKTAGFVHSAEKSDGIRMRQTLSKLSQFIPLPYSISR